MEENKRMNLNMEDLEIVTGGGWTPDTLNAEERAEWEDIGNQLDLAQGSTSLTNAAMERYFDFKARMDAKYGPN